MIAPTSDVNSTHSEVTEGDLADSESSRAARADSSRARRRRRQERAAGVVTPLVIVATWELLAQAGWIDTRFFPAPSAIVLNAGADLVVSGDLLTHLRASLVRIFAGFLVGAIPGLVLGLIMGASRIVRAALHPVLASTYPIPKLAIFPLMLLIFGLGESSKIALISVGVFYLVLFNTVTGVLGIPRIYFDVARDSGASRWRTFWSIALPGASPNIFTGLRLGIGMALLLIVAAEMVGAREGVGFLVWWSWQTFSIELMYSGLILLALLGFLLSLALDFIEARVVPWIDTRS